MRPTISVIVPAFNVQNYIVDSLNSVLNQSESFDELIIIDDGSIDNTVNEIKSVDFTLPVKVIEQYNQGQGIARNEGLKHVTSEYIYFFDSDDLLDVHACKSMKDCISSNAFPDIFLFEGQSFFDTNTSEIGSLPIYKRSFSGSFSDTTSFMRAIGMNSDLSCSPCLYVSRTKIWLENGLSFNKYYHEDEELFYRLLLSCNTYIVKKAKLFYRRVRIGSTMTIPKTLKHVRGQEENLRVLHILLHNWKNDKVISSVLRKRIARFAVTYFRTSRKANYEIDRRLVLKSIMLSRSLLLPLKLTYLTLNSAH